MEKLKWVGAGRGMIDVARELTLSTDTFAKRSGMDFLPITSQLKEL